MDAPAVAVTRDGKQFSAAWMDMRDGRNNRQIYWMPPLPDATTERPLADDPKGIKGHPSLAFDEKGSLHAAWEDYRSGVQRIFYRVATASGKDVPLSPAEGKAAFPCLASGKTVGVAYEWGGNVVFAAP